MDDQVALSFCACGCGNRVRKPKSKFLQGHHSRVNNVSKRPEIKEKRRQNFLRLHAEGKLGKAWNKGLTKEVDERLVKQGQSNSAGWTDERRKKNAETMSQNRLSGVVPTLYGPDHPQWQGGTSSITQIIRGSGNLYREWRYPIMQRDGFKCKDCGKAGDLNVHHDKERFADVLKTCIRIFFDATYREYDRNNPSSWPELTWDEKKAVEATVVDYHTSMKISGITLCHDCHEKRHETEKDED